MRSQASPRRGRPVTSPLHVPNCAPANSIVPAKRRLIRRRRPARDIRSACPNFSMISSMAPATSADRPARDIGGPVPSRPVPSGVAWRSRRQRVRARSSLRAAGRSASRRAFSCLPRRRSRHFFPHVFWVFPVDGAGMYQHRHSQQRRRDVLSWNPIPGPSPEGGPRATSPSRSVAPVRRPRWISRPPQTGSQAGRRQRPDGCATAPKAEPSCPAERQGRRGRERASEGRGGQGASAGANTAIWHT